ncbi:protoporphyrinogen/coproporphyrinogen oxidase [Paenibacillus timonensis]|uniref:protoporphyrinogen/coproporphyrinogen oxidase n=1 Tax=Paenibacillus timonensis TaxID=225915 RepID=UPI003F9B03EB
MEKWDVTVIGGGLAGLTTAAFLAKQGLRTLVLEQSSRWGGRAATDEKDGCLFNIGPHALYSQGQGLQILQELGLDPDGNEAVLGGRLVTPSGIHALPVSALELLKTTAFSFREKLEFARVLTKVSKASLPGECMHLTLEEWVNPNASQENVRKFLYSLFRLGTYSNAPSQVSAGACLRQFQISRGGVRYLHGGWQSMVDSLTAMTQSAGAVLRTGQKVTAISGTYPTMKIQLADHTEVETQSIVAALDPQVTHQLTGKVPNSHLAALCERLIPVRGAALDLALRRLPEPTINFALHIDQPYYFSNHSNVARLTRDERHVVLHLYKYTSPDDVPNAERDRKELEEFLDLLQPGWRNELITSRYLPRIPVTYGLQTVERVCSDMGETIVSDLPGLYLAGDWTVGDPMLSDAAIVSGKAAAEHILHRKMSLATSIPASSILKMESSKERR